MAPDYGKAAEVWVSRSALDFLDQSVGGGPFYTLDDDDVQGLVWLSQYMRVWLLKGPGVEYCSRLVVEHYPHPYEFCLDVLARTIHYNGGRECISRFPSQGHDCEQHGQTAPPFVTNKEFEQILLADEDERRRLHQEYIASQQPRS